MVADELALRLADDYVKPGSRVLDPFCGSGRLLAASDTAATRIGIDANPLAWLISTAKLANVDVEELRGFLLKLTEGSITHGPSLSFMTGRRVRWFSEEVEGQLSQLVHWVNRQCASESALYVIGSILSATARECSFARQSGWKLHRLSEFDRLVKRKDPWTVFRRRLAYCVLDLGGRKYRHGEFSVIRGVTGLANLEKASIGGKFDVVLTSPPYGDSRTTVQYGAASELCLSVVRHINGLDHLFAKGSEIDADCIGGRAAYIDSSLQERCLRDYWAGSAKNPAAGRVRRFLAAYDNTCRDISNVISPDGRAVFIVGRRSTGGFRVKLDDFTISTFEERGFTFERRFERHLRQKRSPKWINRYGRASDDVQSRGSVPTFDRDIVIVMRKLPKTTGSAPNTVR